MRRYVPARKPWTHQEEADQWLRGRSVAALLMAMRTGKSKVALDWFGRLELEGDVQDLAGVAPAGVYRTWLTQADDHLSLDLKRRLRTHLWESGDAPRHRRELDYFMTQHDRPRMLLVNSEATSRVKLIRDVLPAFLMQRRSMCLYDEATSIKAPDSHRAIFAVEKVKPACNYRAILTGLPTPKSPLDAYMQFNFLDHNILGFASYQAFQSRYSVSRRLPHGPVVGWEEDGTPIRKNIPVITGYRDVPGIGAKVQANSFRRTLGDCYDLPPKMYSYRDVEFHPEQRRVYEELRRFATAQLESEEYVTVSHVVTQMLRLHQVLCGHVRTEDGELREVPENRTQQLLEILEEYDGKCVIWCSYDFNVRRLSETISSHFDRPVARFWGGNRDTREREEKMFKEDTDCRDIVGTPHAGRFGRDWKIADLCVFFSNSPDLEHREQGEERLQGIDEKQSKGYIDLRVLNTVDVGIIETLRKKKNLSQVITGDRWRDWI